MPYLIRRHRTLSALLVILPLALGLLPRAAAAAEVRVAVAANFAPCLDKLAPLFGEATGHTVVPIVGSTGRLTAQIIAGAPFHVFLAADRKSCARLVAEGHASADSRFTYARGRLVLWLARTPAPPAGALPELLGQPWIKKVALANPRLAPYGEAARQALARSGLDPDLEGRVVLGTSVGQVQQFAASGHVQAAFLALSQVIDGKLGWHLVLPAELYDPIRQDAVLLDGAQKAGSDEAAAARAFLEFLRTEAAAALMAEFGYAEGGGSS